MWLGREFVETTGKTLHAVLEILTSEYEKQKQTFVKDIISNGPGSPTLTLNTLSSTMVKIHVQQYLIIRDI